MDKVVELSNAAFASFMIQPLDQFDFIADNKIEPHQGDGFAHCLLVLSDECADGALIQCGDDGRAMCSAYVAGARDIVQARLNQAADFIIRQGTAHTASGYWCVYYKELEEKFGLAISEGSGLATPYAHNSRLLVRPGQVVQAWDVVSLSGATGRVTGPHLHFEVRVNGQRTNPRYYLP